MILIELESAGARRARLEFHPRVTIVSGLTSDQRKWLLSALTEGISGSRRDLAISVDVDGEPQPLTPELVAKLGFARAPIDNVIEPADFPGAIVDQSSIAKVAPNQANPAASLMSPLDAAREEYRLAQARVIDIEREMESLGAATHPIDDQELEAAIEAHKRARDAVTELRAQREALMQAGPTMSLSERYRRAVNVRKNLIARTGQLRQALADPAVELELVEELLGEAQQAASDHERRMRELALTGELEVAWQSLAERAQHASQHHGPPEWLVAQTQDELDHAQARVTALSLQAREGIDVQDQLDRAKRQLEDARISWNELQQASGEDPAVLNQERDALYARVVALVGGNPGMERVVEALQKYRERFNERDARDELAELLAEAGVEATMQDAISVAVKWLDQCRANLERRPQLQQELAAVSLNVQEMAEEIESLERRAREAGEDPHMDPLAQLNDQVAAAEVLAREATERVTALRDQSARREHLDEGAVARLEYRLRDAQEEVEVAGRKVDYFAQLATLSGDELPPAPMEASKESTPWWEGNAPSSGQRAVPITADVSVDVSGVSDEDAEFFVLSRAAGLRRIGRGESVPLLIDAAFDGLSPQAALRAFEVLPRIAPIVQIVYLANNDLAERWAKRQPELVAAVVRLEKA